MTSICRSPFSSYIAIIIILLLAASFVISQPLRDEDLLRRSCGNELAERINRICQLRGGHKTYSNTQAGTNIRVRRGIVDECCTEKCTDDHVAAYCVHSQPNATPANILDRPEDDAIKIRPTTRISRVLATEPQLSTTTVPLITLGQMVNYKRAGTVSPHFLRNYSPRGG